MAQHNSDMVFCRRQPGITIGKQCSRCEGTCVICNSFVNPMVKARVCDECAFAGEKSKCVGCGNNGVSDAYYCIECVKLEKDRDGCPKIVNLGSTRVDAHYHHKDKKH